MGIRLGLVGLGRFGSSFASLFKAHPQVDRLALCDREPERIVPFIRRPDFQDKCSADDVYTSLDDICRADLDALVIMTQPWLHAPQAIQALEAGKHVYTAVPIIWIPDGDETLDWCDRLIETCRRTGLHYMLGETSIYRPETMYCRRRAAEGAFGHFVFAEGEYLHDVDSPRSNLRDVQAHRRTGQAGAEWIAQEVLYRQRGLIDGPMHYPTHSTSGPISVMGAHAVKVTAWGFRPPEPDDYFGPEFSNETALFYMSNGATMRINEYRQIGHINRETFALFGTAGSYRDKQWIDKDAATPLSIADMRDPLPEDVATAFREMAQSDDFYGGHGGSHAYLVHEFVSAIAEERRPAIHAWEAVRYMAAGVMAHKSALRDGEMLAVPDWGEPPA